MSEKNRQFILYVLIGAVAIILVAASIHFINLLDEPIPQDVQNEIWVFVTLLLSIAIQVAREYVARSGRKETQQKLDTTLDTVQLLHHEVHNGIQDQIAQKTADKVAATALDVATQLKEENGHDTNIPPP